MATDQTASGGTDDSSGDKSASTTDQTGSAGKDQVSYDTYRKTVSEAKKLKEQLRERDEKLASLEQDKMQAEGKKDELIAQLKTKLGQTEKEKKDQLGSFIYQSLESQVREEAIRLGCIDPELISRVADLSSVDVDSTTYKADKTQLTSLLEDIKKSKPYLFNKAGPKINTELPGTGGSAGGDGKKAPKDMTPDEIRAELNKIKAIEKAN